MCGIMGFVKTAGSTISTPKVITEVFKGLSVRGTDASGWGIVGAKGVTICKAPVASPVITRWKGYRRHLPTADLMIGHTRDATSGPAQVNKNNHPHCSKHLTNILIHNGIIWESRYEYSCRSECDTEVLLRMIEALGMKEACKKMANFHFSMFAWLDLVPEEKVIYAYRDEITPCGYIDLTFSIGGIVIASTVEVVKYALYRAGLEVPDIFTCISSTKEIPGQKSSRSLYLSQLKAEAGLLAICKMTSMTTSTIVVHGTAIKMACFDKDLGGTNEIFNPPRDL